MAQLTPIFVPDIGGASNIRVIEILVQVGDSIEKDTSLITLESEKASIEIPSPANGTVKELKVKIGDLISEGSLILNLESDAHADTKAHTENKETPLKDTKAEKSEEISTSKTIESTSSEKMTSTVHPSKKTSAHAPLEHISKDSSIFASPSTRRLARELEIDLNKITGTGRHGRIMAEDLYLYLKNALKNGGSGSSLPTQPYVDFSKFGSIEEQPLSRIKKISGANLHRNWMLVPHVTQFGEADITELEAFRNSQKNIAEKNGVKMTPIIFLMKAAVAALKRFPDFNASLDAKQENLILKKYFHIGVAVDTPQGLVVPVIRDVDQKGLFDLAKELSAISEKARTKGLMPQDMEGSCFTISSLGGIGGTAFTPIVNVPDVAILGVSRAEMKPVYQNETFVPRLKLPLSLSYDHRVIDGANGARFIQYLSDILSDIRCLLL